MEGVLRALKMSTSSSFWFTPEIVARLFDAVVARFVAEVAVVEAFEASVPRFPMKAGWPASGPVLEPARAAMACALELSLVAVPITLLLPGPGAAAVATRDGLGARTRRTRRCWPPRSRSAV